MYNYPQRATTIHLSQPFLQESLSANANQSWESPINIARKKRKLVLQHKKDNQSDANKENCRGESSTPSLPISSGAQQTMRTTPLSDIGNTTHTSPSNRHRVPNVQGKQKTFEMDSGVNLFSMFNNVLSREVQPPTSINTHRTTHRRAQPPISNNMPSGSQTQPFLQPSATTKWKSIQGIQSRQYMVLHHTTSASPIKPPTISPQNTIFSTSHHNGASTSRNITKTSIINANIIGAAPSSQTSHNTHLMSATYSSNGDNSDSCSFRNIGRLL